MNLRGSVHLAAALLVAFFAQSLFAQASLVQAGAPAQVPAGNCAQGQLDFVAMGFGATVITGVATNLTSLTVSNTGTALPADWVRIRLVREVTINTTVDGTDVIVGTVNSTTFPITFSGLSNQIPVNPQAAVYLLAIDVAGAGTSTVGRTFTLNVTAMTATAAVIQGLPINGNTQTIQAASLCEIDVQRITAPPTSIPTGGNDAVGNRTTAVAFNLTYSIFNTGTQNLNLTGTPLINIPSLSITNCTATVTATPTTPVAASGSTTFTIQVTPTANGPFGFGIRIDNNDATENPYNIIVSGTAVAAVPTINVSTASLPLGTTVQGTAGTAASYTVGGANLTANITITAPTGVELSSTAATGPFTAGLTLVQSGGTVATTTIYARITATATAGAITGDITHTSTGATQQNVTVTGTVTAPAAPEMDVTRGATAVADGLPDAIGTVPSGVAQTITYTIANTGTTTLNLTGGGSLVVATPVSNITSVTVTTPPSASITAAGQTTFTLTYTVTSAAAFNFSVSIANNDANENPYNWNVTGTGAAAVPELDVSRGATPVASGSTDSIGSATSGSGTAVSYTLSNTGTAVLNISAAGATAGTNCTVSVTTVAPGTIAAAGSAPFVVSVTPLAPGAFDFTVTILNDDPNESTYTFTVSGTATTSGGGGGGSSGDSGGCSTGEGSAWWLLLAALPAIVWMRGRRLASRRV